MAVANKYKVQKAQWAKWSDRAKAVFNSVYKVMSDQSLFAHPDATTIPEKHWETTQWNAAWVAASFVDNPDEDFTDFEWVKD